MREIENNAEYYILNETELKLILGGCGFDEFFGPLKAGEESRRRLVETLAGLFQSRKLSPEENGFSVAEGLRGIVDSIGRARCILVLRFPESGESRYVYLSDEPVLCCPMLGEKASFRLKKTNEEEILGLVLDAARPDEAGEKLPEGGEVLWNEPLSLAELELFLEDRAEGRLSVYRPFSGGAFIESSGRFGEYAGEFSGELLSDMLHAAVSFGGRK